ncbi:MAG TPA: adenosine deaminase [Dehalococcoidia bacterium]|nr:adenosine deaminase [Dehalococcoidia bacterium]
MTTPLDDETPLQGFIRAIPKVELHVHLGGTIQPETLLMLAKRNSVELPADTIEGIRDWYGFRDFNHFIEVYMTVSRCLCTADDVELITREFLRGQAEQNVRYTEITYGGFRLATERGVPFGEQLAAINRANDWARTELGVSLGIIAEIGRLLEPEQGLQVAGWAVEGMQQGVIALGLGGAEADHPPAKFRKAFARAREAGLPAVPHAGEVVGAEGIWDALRETNPARIEHGVRCLEDPALVSELRDRQIPLDVCPGSNVALGVVPSIEEHPLPRLIEAGLHVTLNSDDPPMFDTTLTDEYLTCARTFGWDADSVQRIAIDGARASLLPPVQKAALVSESETSIAALREQFEV